MLTAPRGRAKESLPHERTTDMPLYYYYEFDVSLLDIEPRIWRRLQLASDATFQDLHDAIQDAGPWDDDHLFEFAAGPRHREPIATAGDEDRPTEGPGSCPPAHEVPLSSFFSKKRPKCIYLYDFGDGWRHSVELRDIVGSRRKFLRRLVDGARAFPPEDCGGVPGYYMCLAAKDPSNPEGLEEEYIDELRDWIGDYDPEEFDLEAARKFFTRTTAQRRRAQRSE